MPALRLQWLVSAATALLVVLARCALGVEAQSAGAPLRVVVPDLAGMLFPLQSKHRVAFGSSSTATLFASLENDNSDSTDADFIPAEDAGGTGDSSSSSSKSAPCTAQLCVDVLFTSAFASDPFLLAQYASARPVTSSLVSNNDTSVARTIQPVITGTNDSSSSINRVQTRWRFATNASSATEPSLPAIDVVLHLKQRSQFRAAKDQLLLHIAAQRTSERSIATNVESFSLYSNARATYETTRLDATRVVVAVSLARDATQRDAVASDVYPVVAVESDGQATASDGASWTYTPQSQCAQCAAELYNCSSTDSETRCDYDTTTDAVVTCLRDHFQVTSAWLASQLAQQRVGTDLPIQGMLAFCYDALVTQDTASSLASRAWWRSLHGLSCFARYSCPIGSFDRLFGSAERPRVMVALTNTTEFVYSVRIGPPTFTGTVALRCSTSTTASADIVVATVSFNESSTESAIAADLIAALPLAHADVTVEKTFEISAWRYTLTLRHVVFPAFTAQFALSSTNGPGDVSETQAFSAFSALRVVAFDATELALVSTCDTCAAHLTTCQHDDACRSSVLPCLITQLSLAAQSPTVFVPETSTRRMDVFSALHTCTMNVSLATSQPVRKAFVCFASHACAAGTTAVSGASTVFRLVNGSQTFSVTPESSDSDVVALTFTLETARGIETHVFEASLASLALFVQTFVLESAGDVSQRNTVDPADPTKRRVTLTYGRLLAPLPTITARRGITTAEDTSVAAFVESPVDDESDVDNAPSLTALLEVLRAKALPVSPIGAPANYSWVLTPECLRCSARLYECDTVDVANRTCTYASMASPFGRCLRTQLPASLYQDLLNANASNASTAVVSSELAYCARQATSATRSNRVSPVALNSALSCFAATKCPFGPLDRVDGNLTVVLQTSSYVHVLRIPARTFRVTLEYRHDDSAASAASVAIDSAMTRETILTRVASALASSGVTPSLSVFDNEAGGEEWTLEFRYANVVVPGFSVTISSDAEPLAIQIAQVRLQSVPRLAVAPRNPRKLYHQLVDTSRDMKSSECQACVRTELAACQRSRFCHVTVLPCFATRLEATAANSSVQGMDVRGWLHACAASGNATATNATVAASGAAFYSWWAPLQRFVACLARAQCRVSTSSASTALSDEAGFIENTRSTVLTLTPGSETLFVPLANASAETFALDVAPPAMGTSFSGQAPYAFVGGETDLERLLAYMTMDTASNVTVDIGALGTDGLARVSVSYGDDYIGHLPALVPRDGGRSDGAVPPRLVFASSVVTAAASDDSVLDWSALLALVRNASSNSTAVSSPNCVACEQQFLAACQSSSVCSGQVLTCLHRTMSETNSSSIARAEAKDGLLPLGADRDLLSGLLACAEELPLSAWRSLQSFFLCFEQEQCEASTTATAAPSYIRLQRGRIRLSLPAPDPLTATAFAASLVALQASLNDLVAGIGDSAAVSVLSWQHPPAASHALLQRVEITFSGYFGTLPVIPVASAAVLYTPPRLVLYSASRAASPSQTQLASTFARYIRRPECSGMCADRLAWCDRGDERPSLVCREVILPCLDTALTSGNATTSAFDLAVALRLCTGGSILAAAEPVVDYITCFDASECPLSAPDVHVVPTFLDIAPGSETLQVPLTGAVTLTIHHPSDASPAQVAFVDEFTLTATNALELASFMETEVFDSRTTVQVQVSPSASSRTLVITYGGGYLGDLPVITGIGVQSLVRVLPQALGIAPPPAPLRWDVFTAQVARHVTNTTTKRAGCSTCAAKHLANCTACAPILQCLAATLRSPGADDVTLTNGDTGADFTHALQTCVASYTAAQWFGLGDFFTCLMDHACQVGPLALVPYDDSATYVSTRAGTTSFDVETDLLPLDITLLMPPDLGGAMTSTVIDRSDNYAQLIDTLTVMLVSAGVGAQARVTIADEQSTPTTRTVTLTYHGYYGQLPTIAPVAGLSSPSYETAQLAFQSLEATAVWDGIYALFGTYLGESSVSPTQAPSGATPPPASAPVRVLTSDCAQCGVGFFGCPLASINDGSCGYASASATFAKCFARELDAATYEYLLTQGVGTVVDTPAALSTCYAEIASADAAASPASFRDDLWYAASEALACFDMNSCPLGPLDVAVTADFMVHLESTSVTRTFALSGETFSDAVFIVKFGARTVTSGVFSESTPAADLEVLLTTALPSRVSVTVTTVLRADNSGYDVTLVLSRLYYPDSTNADVQIQIGSAAPVDGVIQDAWTSKLVVVAVDATKFTIAP